MITLLALPSAVLLDWLVGDPAVPLHPVRLVGRLAAWVERKAYARSKGRRSGILAWLVVVLGAVIPVGLLLALAERVGPLAVGAISTLAIYISIAPRDLTTHAKRVNAALAAGDLRGAREAVACLVGRDTAHLDEAGVARAAVEAVAESTVDAVTAPLFWAAVLGPLGAVAYRAVNTLDSMWGHQDERYVHFGWCAARADDAMNLLPARLTLALIAAASVLLRLDGWEAYKLGLTQGLRHRSPNSGLSEAAFAGALGVALGGTNYYDGVRHEGAVFGSVTHEPCAATLRRAIALMWATTFVSLLCLGSARFLVVCSH